MKAVYINELGPADRIVYGELPTPPVGKGEVLVRTEAVVVNPRDTYIRAGTVATPLRFPFVLGSDLVGTVAELGPGVAGFGVGDRVWTSSLGHAGRQGTFAEYVCVPRDRLYPLPAGVDAVQAVAVFHPATTAYLGLFRHAGLERGEVVFVAGGAGNVGAAVIQMAVSAGARVVASCRGEEDVGFCRRLGCFHAIDYRSTDQGDQLRAAAPDGINVYWDTFGRNDLETAVGVLAHGGRIVLMAGLSGRPVLPVGPFYVHDGRIVGFALANARVEELADAAAAINALLAKGSLAARIGRVLPLAAAVEAHRLMEGSSPAGRVRGRIVLVPGEEVHR